MRNVVCIVKYVSENYLSNIGLLFIDLNMTLPMRIINWILSLSSMPLLVLS